MSEMQKPEELSPSTKDRSVVGFDEVNEYLVAPARVITVRRAVGKVALLGNAQLRSASSEAPDPFYSMFLPL